MSKSGQSASTGFKSCKHKAAIKAKAWVEVDGRSLLGTGRANLLKEIDRTGSISAAASCMGVSYRTAWVWICKMNEKIGCSLVVTTTGGKGGGGAKLTSEGKAILEAYNSLETKLQSFIDKSNKTILK